MIVNNASLNALRTGFKANFQKAFAAQTPLWNKIATLVPSETSEETYAWLGDLPGFREWIGDRVINALAENGYVIKNKDFELTIGVPRNVIEDDRYGIFGLRFAMMGEAAAMFPDSLVFKALKNGFTNLCYDEKPFFSTEHPVGKKGKASNLGTAKLTPESYGTARSGMMSLKNDAGDPLNIKPNVLVVPPALETQALKITKADLIDNSTNIYKDTAEVLMVPELAGKDNAWFLLDTNRVLKPFIYQQRKKPEFTEQTDPNSDSVFNNNEFRYGCDARGNAGYTLWQLAYGSDGTGA